MHALLDKSHLVSAPIQEGDAGVVLKLDGSFQIFSTGKLDPLNLTEEQRALGKKLVCLTIALKSPRIMAMLEELLSDPIIMGTGVDLGFVN